MHACFFQILSLLAFLFSFSVVGQAQTNVRYWRVGLGLGATNASTDLTPGIRPANTGGLFSLQASRDIRSFLLWRNQLSGSYLRGSSSNQRDDLLAESDLSFSTFAITASTGLQYDFLPYRDNSKRRRGTPYLFGLAEIGYGTEKGGVLSGLNLGLGYKKAISYYWDFGIELSGHFWASDQVEGLAKDDFPATIESIPLTTERNDVSYDLSISFTYHFLRVRCP